MPFFRASLRHPLTGRRIKLRASSARQLEAYRHAIDSMRSDLRLGLRSKDDVARALCRIEHGPVTLERAARAYCDRGKLAPTTRDAIRSLIATHFAELGGLELASLDTKRVSEWVDKLLASGLEASSVGTLWRRLRAIGRFALERRWIHALPWGEWRPRLGPKSRRSREACRSIEELARLLDAAREFDDASTVYRALEAKIATAALLGLRRGELAGLRWRDVDRAAATIRIARQWDGRKVKASSEGTLPAPEVLWAVLETHAAVLRGRELFALDGPIFPRDDSQNGKPRPYVKGEIIRRGDLRAAVERAGLPNVSRWSSHSLRDTFVTLEAQAQRGDLKRVSMHSRHASIASLARYLQPWTRDAVVTAPKLPEGRES